MGGDRWKERVKKQQKGRRDGGRRDRVKHGGVRKGLIQERGGRSRNVFKLVSKLVSEVAEREREQAG